MGGIVGNGVEVAGSQVTITGGAVGDNFSAFDGSDVMMSGGVVGNNFSAFGGTRVTISGGSIGEFFHAHGGSQVDLYGTEFVLNGSGISELTLGEMLAISARDVDLIGHLADGAPFSFVLNIDPLAEEFFSPSGTLTVPLVSLLEGDYNSNGLVEQQDLDLVLANWGDELLSPFAAGWINDLPSGVVDQEELDRVLANWGTSMKAVAASVPEPSAAAILHVLSLLVVTVRRLE